MDIQTMSGIAVLLSIVLPLIMFFLSLWLIYVIIREAVKAAIVHPNSRIAIRAAIREGLRDATNKNPKQEWPDIK